MRTSVRLHATLPHTSRHDASRAARRLIRLHVMELGEQIGGAAWSSADSTTSGGGSDLFFCELIAAGCNPAVPTQRLVDLLSNAPNPAIASAAMEAISFREKNSSTSSPGTSIVTDPSNLDRVPNSAAPGPSAATDSPSAAPASILPCEQLALNAFLRLLKYRPGVALNADYTLASIYVAFTSPAARFKVAYEVAAKLLSAPSETSCAAMAAFVAEVAANAYAAAAAAAPFVEPVAAALSPPAMMLAVLQSYVSMIREQCSTVVAPGLVTAQNGSVAAPTVATYFCSVPLVANTLHVYKLLLQVAPHFVLAEPGLLELIYLRAAIGVQHHTGAVIVAYQPSAPPVAGNQMTRSGTSPPPTAAAPPPNFSTAAAAASLLDASQTAIRLVEATVSHDLQGVMSMLTRSLLPAVEASLVAGSAATLSPLVGHDGVGGQSPQNGLESSIRQLILGIALNACVVSLSDESRQSSTSAAVSAVLKVLLDLAVADPDPIIRRLILDTFTQKKEFDRLLIFSESLEVIFMVLHDADSTVSEAGVAVACRLAVLNPAAVVPSIKRLMAHLIRDYQAGSLVRCIDAARKLSRIVACSSVLAVPTTQLASMALDKLVQQTGPSCAALQASSLTLFAKTLEHSAVSTKHLDFGYIMDRILPILTRPIIELGGATRLAGLRAVVASIRVVGLPQDRHLHAGLLRWLYDKSLAAAAVDDDQTIDELMQAVGTIGAVHHAKLRQVHQLASSVGDATGAAGKGAGGGNTSSDRRDASSSGNAAASSDGAAVTNDAVEALKPGNRSHPRLAEQSANVVMYHIVKCFRESSSQQQGSLLRCLGRFVDGISLQQRLLLATPLTACVIQWLEDPLLLLQYEPVVHLLLGIGACLGKLAPEVAQKVASQLLQCIDGFVRRAGGLGQDVGTAVPILKFIAEAARSAPEVLRHTSWVVSFLNMKLAEDRSDNQDIANHSLDALAAMVPILDRDLHLVVSQVTDSLESGFGSIKCILFLQSVAHEQPVKDCCARIIRASLSFIRNPTATAEEVDAATKFLCTLFCIVGPAAHRFFAVMRSTLHQQQLGGTMSEGSRSNQFDRLVDTYQTTGTFPEPKMPRSTFRLDWPPVAPPPVSTSVAVPPTAASSSASASTGAPATPSTAAGGGVVVPALNLAGIVRPPDASYPSSASSNRSEGVTFVVHLSQPQVVTKSTLALQLSDVLRIGPQGVTVLDVTRKEGGVTVVEFRFDLVVLAAGQPPTAAAPGRNPSTTSMAATTTTTTTSNSIMPYPSDISETFLAKANDDSSALRRKLGIITAFEKPVTPSTAGGQSVAYGSGGDKLVLKVLHKLQMTRRLADNPKDWMSWLVAFAMELVLCSPEPAFRVLAEVVQQNERLATDILPFAFAAAYSKMMANQRQSAMTLLSHAVSAASASVRHHLFVIAEFMEDERSESVTVVHLEVAQVCRVLRTNASERFGINYEKEGNALVVTKVAPGGPGATAGVEVGFTLKSIDNVPIFNVNEIVKLITDKCATTLLFTKKIQQRRVSALEKPFVDMEVLAQAAQGAALYAKAVHFFEYVFEDAMFQLQQHQWNAAHNNSPAAAAGTFASAAPANQPTSGGNPGPSPTNAVDLLMRTIHQTVETLVHLYGLVGLTHDALGVVRFVEHLPQPQRSRGSFDLVPSGGPKATASGGGLTTSSAVSSAESVLVVPAAPFWEEEDNVAAIVRFLDSKGDFHVIVDQAKRALGNIPNTCVDRCAHAAFVLSDWRFLDAIIPQLPAASAERRVMEAAVLVASDAPAHRVHQVATECRRMLHHRFCSEVAESYATAYETLVTLQHITQIEECLVYKSSSEERRAVLRGIWKRRVLQGTPTATHWAASLAINSLVMQPEEDADLRLRFVAVCRDASWSFMAERALKQLLRVDDLNSVRFSAGSDPKIALAFFKHLWRRTGGLQVTERLATIERMTEFVNTFLSNRSSTTDVESVCSCLLRLSDWVLQVPGRGEAAALEYVKEATLVDPSNAAAWHAWGMLNLMQSRHALGAHAGGAQAAAATDPSSLMASVANAQVTTTGLPYLVCAIEGFFRAIAVGEDRLGIQDSLRILTAWFPHGHHDSVHFAVKSGIDRSSAATWLRVVPQLISRVGTAERRTRQLLVALISRVGIAFPNALLFPLSVCHNTAEPKSLRRSAAKKILAAVREAHPAVARDAQIISEDLIRMAILWPERWNEALQAASKMHADAAAVNRILAPLYQELEHPVTANEKNFDSIFGQALKRAQHALRLQTEQSVTQAWTIFQQVYTQLGKASNQRTLVLSQVAPQLAEMKTSHFIVPGTFEPSSTVVAAAAVGSVSAAALAAAVSGASLDTAVTIVHFLPEVQVITSKQKPRRFGVLGSNGVEYHFLLKGHEDLRQDERVMQLFDLINTAFRGDPGSTSLHLSVTRYSVTPLSANVGLIGWINETETIFRMIEARRLAHSASMYEECNLIVREGRLAQIDDYQKLPKEQRRQLLHLAITTTPSDELRRVFWDRNASCESWMAYRSAYGRSLAVMSMVGYILGLGDRHLNNLLLHKTGSVIHIDFGDCFEAAMHRSRYPEAVPFRLTRLLVSALGVSKVEGTFRLTCEHVMRLLRKQRDMLLSLMETFVYDPLVNWKMGGGGGGGALEGGTAATGGDGDAAAAAVAAEQPPYGLHAQALGPIDPLMATKWDAFFSFAKQPQQPQPAAGSEVHTSTPHAASAVAGLALDGGLPPLQPSRSSAASTTLNIKVGPSGNSPLLPATAVPTAAPGASSLPPFTGALLPNVVVEGGSQPIAWAHSTSPITPNAATLTGGKNISGNPPPPTATAATVLSVDDIVSQIAEAVSAEAFPRALEWLRMLRVRVVDDASDTTSTISMEEFVTTQYNSFMWRKNEFASVAFKRVQSKLWGSDFQSSSASQPSATAAGGIQPPVRTAKDGAATAAAQAEDVLLGHGVGAEGATALFEQESLMHSVLTGARFVARANRRVSMAAIHAAAASGDADGASPHCTDPSSEGLPQGGAALEPPLDETEQVARLIIEATGIDNLSEAYLVGWAPFL